MAYILESIRSSLQDQFEGKNGAIERIEEFVELFCGTKVHRDDSLTNTQVESISRVLSEWREMFSFEPGRVELIPELIEVLKYINKYQNINDLDSINAWKKIKSIRGPGSSVLKVSCEACSFEYNILYFGSFSGGYEIENVGFCLTCENLEVRHSKGTNFLHSCNGKTVTCGCPSCGHMGFKEIASYSPYEHFRTHSYSTAGFE